MFDTLNPKLEKYGLTIAKPPCNSQDEVQSNASATRLKTRPGGK